MPKFYFIFILMVFASCNKNEQNEDDQNALAEYCKVKGKVDESLFSAAPKDYLVINGVEINGDCMTINFSSGGCNGDSWQISLVGAEKLIYTGIPKREIRLSLDNKELCDAWITKEYTFDISTFQISEPKVILFLTNNGVNYNYEY